MASKNQKRDSILRFLLTSTNHESDIVKISESLKIDYNDSIVFCDDILEKQLADSVKTSAPGSAKKNKILTLSPRGISFIREGGFVKLAKKNLLKAFLNLVIPILALCISLAAIVITYRDTNEQNKKWRELNKPRMDITEMKIQTWKTFNNVQELLNHQWGYTIPYTCNAETGQCSILSYLTFFENDNNTKPLTQYKLFSTDEVIKLAKSLKVKHPVYVDKNLLVIFNFKNNGTTQANNLTIDVLTKENLDSN